MEDTELMGRIDLDGLTIAGAANLIGRRNISPLELTEAFLSRIERLNPSLNAFITVTGERAREDAREGKSPSTQAGEFVREEIHHVREGKHGARSPEQAIAIGLSKARRAGVKVPAKKGGSTRSKSRTTKKRSKPSAKHYRTLDDIACDESFDENAYCDFFLPQRD